MIQIKVKYRVIGVKLTNQTLMQCIDNSGAAIVECASLMKLKRAAKVGKIAIYDE
jgi:ribosomal protein L14